MQFFFLLQSVTKPITPTSTLSSSSHISSSSSGNDPVYECTTSVVRSVMQLLQGVQKGQHADYLELVKVMFIEKFDSKSWLFNCTTA